MRPPRPGRRPSRPEPAPGEERQPAGGQDGAEAAAGRLVGVVKVKGAGEQLVEGPTKMGRSRVVDITLTVYQLVHPGMGRQAADRFAAVLEG